MGYQRFAPVFLRIGLAFVFLLFGAHKLSSPGQGASETQLLTNFELADAAALNFYLGLVEIIVAASFIFGFRVRLFSFVSSILVSLFFLSFVSKYGIGISVLSWEGLAVKFGLQINPDIYRDVGLLGASIALFLLGSGPLSIDSFFANKKTEVNKYLSLLIFAVFLMSSGIFYQQFYRPASIGNFKSTGNEVEIHMRVAQNTWRWEPDTIRVNPGDKVILHIFNEDTYDHGFAIDVFGVNRRLFPKSTTTIQFTPSFSGKFNFYCSVPCGQGHYDQVGTLIVGEKNSAGSSIVPNKNFACNTTNKLVDSR